MKTKFVIGMLMLYWQASPAQTETNNSLAVNTFIELYYQVDLNNIKNKAPNFLYNYNSTNAIALNLALIEVAHKTKHVQSKIGLMAGDYARLNLSAEPNIYQFINEASITYSTSNTWSLSAGIIPCHMGYEYAKGSSNITLSRSLMAEGSPYFETGLRLDLLKQRKFNMALLVLNGWQNITETNNDKSAGWVLNYKPNNKHNFSISGYFGNDNADSIPRANRLFNNAYYEYMHNTHFKAVLVADYGLQNSEGKTNIWKALALIAQYSPNRFIKTALRAEYYSDPNATIVKLNNTHALDAVGFSINTDYSPVANLIFRNEIRLLSNRQPIFLQQNGNNAQRLSYISSILVDF